MPWTGHVACMQKCTDAYSVSVGKSERIENLKDLGVDGRIVLKRIMRKLD
jgi:hypothetical protein